MATYVSLSQEQRDRLAAELSLPEYDKLSAAEAAALLNTRDPGTRRRVPISELMAGAYQTGVYGRLLVAERDPATSAKLYGAARSLLDLKDARFDDISLDIPAAQEMMADLIEAGLISPAEAALISGLADVPGQTRAEILGLGEVSEEQVQGVRELTARRTGYAELRERLLAGVHGLIASLAIEESEGKNVPTWEEALTRL